MCIFPRMCVCIPQVLEARRGKGTRFPGIAVPDGHEQGTENQAGSSAEQLELLKAEPSLQHLLLLLVPQVRLSVVWFSLWFSPLQRF